MNIKQLILATVIISLCYGGDYLDNYFCQNEICNQYWVNCKAAEQTAAQKQYCATRQLFLDCINLIDLNGDSTSRNNGYNACRNQVKYDNANDFFYFLNCQVNCGYQSLWLQCAQQMNQIGNCPKKCDGYTEDYQDWINNYLQCTAFENMNMCAYVSDDLLSDCQNSVQAKCKYSVAQQLGSGNSYVNLMFCSSYSNLLIISIFALFSFFLL